IVSTLRSPVNQGGGFVLARPRGKIRQGKDCKRSFTEEPSVFDIHQSIGRDGEIDERRVGKYIDGLMEEFAASPEAQPIIEQYGGVSWAAMMMDYAFNYIGTSVPKMALRDFNEVVFDLFPRKVSTEPDSAPQVIAELRAFWSFLHRQYGLPN